MAAKAVSGSSGKSSPESQKLGTFAGVFTPSILTILGIILFMRLGYVVGSAGLGRALLILALANGISVLTTFSLSTIATNLKVKGGGDYYLISRTLGLEFGGSIGIVLYLAQSVSIGFYCIGFAEILTEMLQIDWELLPQLIAGAAVAFLFVFAWLGADWATRFQYVVMSILGMALLSFFIGGFALWDQNLLAQNWSAAESSPEFWIIFAIFFPAVTGFTQGVSMSGDLKDPGKSLPRGTFMAVGLSIAIYAAASVVFAAALPQHTLVSDYSAMQQVATIGFLIIAGVIAATLSSAMASFLGAPRILQSLAGDRIFPFLLPFAKGYGRAGNPRRGVLLSAAIAYLTIGLGNLNVIAPVVSMFFLISYGLLNYATYFEARSGSPSFRPRFRWYHYRVSLVGALACLTAMLAIDPLAGAAAIAVLFGIYQYLRQTAGPARWADSRRSYYLQNVRQNLLAAAAEPEHARYWRPQILLFSDESHYRRRLLRLAAWVQGESGFVTVVKILEANYVQAVKLREELEGELKRDIQESGVAAFPLLLAVPNLSGAIGTLVQSFGIGPVRANCIFLNWIEQPSDRSSYYRMIYSRNLRAAFRLGCNLVILDADGGDWQRLEATPPTEKRIDVWWNGDATSHLMLLLAYLMTRNPPWESAKIRVISTDKGDDTDAGLEEMGRFLDDARIDAESATVKGDNVEALITATSDATLVFLPFRLRQGELLDLFGDPLEIHLTRLPTVVMVMAAQDIDLDAEPEEGVAGERAAASDALMDLRKRVRAAEKEVEEVSRTIEKIKGELDPLRDADPGELGEKEISNSARRLVEELKRLETAQRKLTKDRARAKIAEKEAEALGVIIPENRDGTETS
jgi:amino acid transporter